MAVGTRGKTAPCNRTLDKKGQYFRGNKQLERKKGKEWNGHRGTATWSIGTM